MLLNILMDPLTIYSLMSCRIISRIFIDFFSVVVRGIKIKIKNDKSQFKIVRDRC